MEENKSTFELDKDTIIMCLQEIMSSAFCAYEGDNEKIGNADFEDADLLTITEKDWKDIGHPWNNLEPRMNSYFEILNQAPKEWFKKEKINVKNNVSESLIKD